MADARSESDSRTRNGDPASLKLEAAALYVLVFVCGAVLMSAEIAGSRVLSPFFGSAVFVWGSLIGVIMVALAAGYYAGGILSDRFPSFALLCGIVAGAGLFLLVMPAFAVPLCGLVESAFPGPRAGPLISSVLLFLVPGMLLAVVSPFAVRLSAKGLSQLGNVAGRLYALSTAGSIVGTLATTFVLIPLMGTKMLVFSLGVVLVLVSVGGLLAARGLRGRGWRAPAALVLLSAIVAALAAPEGPGAEVTPWYEYATYSDLVAEHELVAWSDSAYHLILVTEQHRFREPGTERVRPRRLLRFNDRTQSAIYIDDEAMDRSASRYVQELLASMGVRAEGRVLDEAFARLKRYESAVGYTDLLHLGLIFCPDARKALVVGAGGGIAPTEFVQHYGMEVDVAELDPEVERIAREFFYVDPRVRFHIGDGRRTLARLEGGYDLIVLDAYSGGGHVPAHLTTKEFLELCRSKLSSRGVVVSNVISALKDEKSGESRFYQSEYKTMYAAGFANLYTFPRYATPEEERRGRRAREDYWGGRSINIIIVATQDPVRKSPAEIEEAARALAERPERPAKVKTLVHYAKGIWEGRRSREEVLAEMTSGIVLTDDYCPVDTMFHDR